MEVDGDIDLRTAMRRLRKKTGAFQACYEQALKVDAQLRGKVGMELVIGAGGRVVDVDIVDDRLGSATVARCVKKTARRIRMPAPTAGEVVVSYMLVFTPRRAGDRFQR